MTSQRLSLHLASIGLFSLPCFAQMSTTALPTGGIVSAGVAAISQSSTGMRIDQLTPKAVIDWSSFNIGRDATVHFYQPSNTSIALNRIGATGPANIEGSLLANGHIWLLNPGGVLFGSTARVEVGGLLASSLKLGSDDFMGSNYHFTKDGGGSIVNQGEIIAAEGSYVALMAPEVRNEGIIAARLGSIALVSGDEFRLDFVGDRLIEIKIDQATANGLVKNTNLLQADGGFVLMSTDMANRLSSGAVNNSGIISAKTITEHEGVIKLLGGEVAVGGTLDASALNGGNGGFIETSGKKVHVDADTRITTLAPRGKTGRWLIDPNDYTIAETGGDIDGKTLGTNLDNTNVFILSDEGIAVGNGDIFVNDAVTWSSGNELMLSAFRDININSSLVGTGGGNIVLRADNTGTGHGTVNFSNKAIIDLTGEGGLKTVDIYYNPVSYSSPTDFTGNVTAGTLTAWMLVNDAANLQAISSNLAGNYALGKSIDLSDTHTFDNGAGFTPLGSLSTPFVGKFTGLWNTVSGLFINRPTEDYVGLFGVVDNRAVVSNVTLLGVEIYGHDQVGGMIGYLANESSILGSGVTGIINGSSNIGGIVGTSYSGTIDSAYNSAQVTGITNVGGLVGMSSSGLIRNSYNMGAITGTTNVGGLLGKGIAGSIEYSYNTGLVVGESNIGGLAGEFSDGKVFDSYWDIDASGLSVSSGGGVGYSIRDMTQPEDNNDSLPPDVIPIVYVRPYPYFFLRYNTLLQPVSITNDSSSGLIGGGLVFPTGNSFSTTLTQQTIFTAVEANISQLSMIMAMTTSPSSFGDTPSSIIYFPSAMVKEGEIAVNTESDRKVIR